MSRTEGTLGACFHGMVSMDALHMANVVPTRCHGVSTPSMMIASIHSSRRWPSLRLGARHLHDVGTAR